MKDPKESATPIDSHIIDPVGAIKITQNIEFETQLMKAHTKGGLGFMAEDANSLHDRWQHKKVEDIGRNNEKNGADRIVDGVYIQTKYYDTAAKTINSAFDVETGMYRYYQKTDGKPMLLEVPKDQYEQVVNLMREKIKEGKVAGVTDPEEAQTLVKAGCVTFKQARNIAKAGNIDSLLFDAKQSVVSAASSLGISFIINFALLKYKEIDTGDALKISFVESIKTGGSVFISSVLVRQFFKTAMGRGLLTTSTQASKSAVNSVYNYALGKDTIHKFAAVICEKHVTGVAAKNVVIKFFRTNVIVNTTFILINTVPDFIKFMDNRMSWKELTASITRSMVGFAAFTAGFSVASRFPLPVPMKMIIPALTGILSSLAASDVVFRLLKTNKERKEYNIIQEAIQDLCNDYMIINEDEFDACMEEIQKRDIINEDFITHIKVRETDKIQKAYVYTRLKGCFLYVINKREQIVVPTEKQLMHELDRIDMSEEDMNQIFINTIK